MKKNFNKILIFTMMIMTLLSTISFAGEDNVAGEIGAKGKVIVSAVLWLGYALSLGMVVFIGIKYILGSAESKANMKSAIVSWLIGAVLVFGCTSIVGWVLSATGLSDDSGLPSQIIDAANSGASTGDTTNSSGQR